MTTSDVLVWTDVETTGLSVTDGHLLLEVAAIVTDPYATAELAVGNWTVRYDRERANWMREVLADDYVRAMHDTSGLWTKLPHGTPTEQIEKDLLAMVKPHAPEPRQARMAGNSVRLDLNFCEAFLPGFYNHLHYRSLDVSALAYAANTWKGAPIFPKQMRHEALADIRESIAEYRHIMGLLAAENASVG